jgi:DNA-binding Lrp family transcriptional regulator
MELNLRQKKILELLSINCRFSNKDIARTIGMSEDAVDYQINKLIDKEKISHLSIQFDYRFLGYDHYHIWIQLKDLDFNVEDLKKIKSITSINSSYGAFDLQLIAITRNKEELSKSLESIEKILDIRNICIAEFDSFYKQFTNVISPLNIETKIPTNKKHKIYDLNNKFYADAKKIEKIKLDEIDMKIIKELLKNPRAKFSEISEETKINHETIRYRINNYVQTKFIKSFGLLHDFRKYGLYTNYLLLKLKNVNKKNFEDYLYSNNEIFYSAKLIGEYNCILYITSKDPNEFGKQLKDIRKTLGDSIVKMDLLYLEEFHKYVQFPEELL